jgi:hypothetical protein
MVSGCAPIALIEENQKGKTKGELIMKTRFPLIAAFLLVAPAFLPVAVHAATITVTSTADNGSGTLRAALASATDGDAIDATGVAGTILLTSGELLVTNSVTITGPGPANLAVNGNAASRVFHINTNTTVTISGLTITDGSSDNGGGIYNDNATLTVSNSTVSGNSASQFGGGIYNDGGSCCANLTLLNSSLRGNMAHNGGGIVSTFGVVMVQILNSTLSGNSATSDAGGILSEGGTLTVSNSTLSGNSATFIGGGIEIALGTLTVSNSTLSGNSASGPFSGGGIANGGTMTIINSTLSGNTGSGAGGGIYNTGPLQIGSTILNAGVSGANISNNLSGTVTSLGYNLSSDNGGGFLTGVSDQINTNPLLGPLQDNGGPTFTMALRVGRVRSG